MASRRPWLHACIVPVLVMAVPALGTSAATRPALWSSYQANPSAHPNLPNCSYAGYAYGERPLPELPVVARASDFGAVADGKTEAAGAIQAALKAAAAKGGGAVLLDAGTYRISDVLFMHDDGVVLRGAGPAKTTLSVTRPLAKALGPNNWDGKSGWSWSGGFVWFAPRTLRSARANPLSRENEGWHGTTELAGITAPAKRGGFQLAVAEAGKLRAGDRVLLSLTSAEDHALYRNMLGNLPGAARYDWKNKAAAFTDGSAWKWPVEIASVEGKTVTLKQPLRTDVQVSWSPRLLELGPVVRESGVEHLTIQMAPAALSAHLENPGWNAIAFENAWNCWAHDVVVQNVDNGIGTTASKCITVDGFQVVGRACHHATYCRVSSHDTLWTRFSIDASVHHGLNVEGLSSGNVWSAGNLAHGTFDSHRALPFENLRTDITIYNDGGHGGSGDAGPLFGARFAHWNIRVLNGQPAMVHVAAMMPRGAVVGIQGAGAYAKPYPDFDGESGAVVEAEGQAVAPADLHLAQLALRTGKVPYHLGRPLEVALARADGTRIVVSWVETFQTDRHYELSRRTEKTPWNDRFAVVHGPISSYEDRDVVTGERYTYRVRSVSPVGTSAWSAEATMLHRPAPVTDLTWQAREDGVALTWAGTREMGGTIVIDRRAASGGAAWQEGIGRVSIDQRGFQDRSVERGSRCVYRVRVVNASGSGEPAEVTAFRRAKGTVMMQETFDVKQGKPLPATSDAPGGFGTRQWVGSNRDSHPSLQAEEGSSLPLAKEAKADLAGRLGWPIAPIGARSFVYTEHLRGDLSDVGAQVSFDVSNGSSGISTHELALCLRLADGKWISAGIGFTYGKRGWHRMDVLLEGLKWQAFDPQRITTGDAVERPDLLRVTGVGLLVSRPINNRWIQFDNLQVWGKALAVEPGKPVAP